MLNKKLIELIQKGLRGLGILLFCSLLSAVAFAESADELFDDGIAAFKRNDHINTVKNLYAYLQLNSQSITAQSANEIKDAIDFAEKNIQVALRTKEELDKFGKVTEVVVTAEGKMDSAAPKKSTKRFRAPADIRDKKPPLPNVKAQHIKPSTESRTRPINQARLAEAPKRASADNLLAEKYTALKHQNEELTRDCNARYASVLEKIEKKVEKYKNDLRSCQSKL